MLAVNVRSTPPSLLHQLEGVPEDSWVVNEGIAIEPGRDVFKQYTTCLYWTIMTLTTVGYGVRALLTPPPLCCKETALTSLAPSTAIKWSRPSSPPSPPLP